MRPTKRQGNIEQSIKDGGQKTTMVFHKVAQESL